MGRKESSHTHISEEIVLYTGKSPLEAPFILWDIETVPYQLIL